ncbi:Peptidoglycan-binding domain 1 protein [Chthoniobacter flavus Ellin428]|uniref:Peptidoglycan-binding domain 1 protein n=1 Tax=Chthoniobacter flavus Ellin428 TaxID=497964 RepID=B4D8M2_9BACT|nr:peptidoglycan-binding domain-containing protein [Chthoniobacter flavus]EDY17244.1 Peptidoglycan-binding domain 1 protein [Chthoniobacter flavus Ellin428]TCO86933.1 putative peptidoglycan binding protein [Chthoniobacter flavus]
MKRHFVCLALACSIMSLYGDDATRSTQEELRRRNIYFGDIDGRASPELEQALKHYQKRKGLAVSGMNDHDTLRSLGVIGRGANEAPPKELVLPDEPVLKSDIRINVKAEATEIAADTGVSPASVDPAVIAAGEPRARRRGKSAHTREPVVQSGTGGATTAERTRTKPGAPMQIPGGVEAYLANYLHAVSHNQLQDELHFYADRVNYLGNGWVDRRIIEHTLGKYYARWPHRSYSRIERISTRTIPRQGVIVVDFRVAFKFENGKAKARGETDNEIVINAATSDPRIISIKERRVRR